MDRLDSINYYLGRGVLTGELTQEQADKAREAFGIRNLSTNNLADVNYVKALETVHSIRISQLEETVEFMKGILEKNNLAKFDSYI